jgi:crotonobetaine/carnitine-CoA ligase
MMIHGKPARWNNLCELIRERAAEGGDRVGITIGEERLTYRQWDARSDALATGLEKLGIEEGDRVAAFAYNNIVSALGLIACAKLRAVWAPMNAGLVGQELERTLQDAGPKVLFLDPELVDTFKSISGAAQNSVKVYVIGPECHGFLSTSKLTSESATRVVRIDPRPIDPAVIIYTGGTTGMPKAAVLSHFSLICAGYRYIEAFRITPQDSHMSVMMMFHVGGLLLGVVGPLIANIPTTLLKWFSVSQYWNDVRKSGATILDLIGPMIALLCKEPISPDDRDHHARISMGAVGQVAPEIPDEFERRFGVRLLKQFSQTECGGILAIYKPVDQGPNHSVGKSTAWAEAIIVDEFDQPVPSETVGEICLRQLVPYTFMTKYFGKDATTVDTLRNGMLHTGDLGYFDKDGWLFFVGRQAHWIRRRGENISSYEVESVLGRFPGVFQAAVVGVPSDIGEEDVKAFIIPDQGVTIDPAALVTWCEDKLAAFKIPRFVSFVSDFPRSTTKKEILRHVLREVADDAPWDSETVFGRRSARRPKIAS